jgi:hypothetical protein
MAQQQLREKKTVPKVMKRAANTYTISIWHVLLLQQLNRGTQCFNGVSCATSDLHCARFANHAPATHSKGNSAVIRLLVKESLDSPGFQYKEELPTFDGNRMTIERVSGLLCPHPPSWLIHQCVLACTL